MLLTRLIKGGASSSLLYNKLEMEVSNMIPKFKAWDKIDKVIREVTAIDWSLDLVEFMHGANERSFENVILLQSTGLKDKSSVEIYEGDIVSVRNHPFQKTELSGVGIEIDGDYLIGWSDHNLTWLAGDLLLYQLKPYIEVIGNIYENPELLEVQR
ncbi:YopX family protein [Enterococcus avium]|uniref:YopX family protein n=1 Tax=Enterococcus avium TaxID=33945 RepID=A0AAW8S098_ENTAV|nr:YopX family protein [Enterococcus avium]MDT2403896.1 YopX family protein [Enterococcus avium]